MVIVSVLVVIIVLFFTAMSAYHFGFAKGIKWTKEKYDSYNDLVKNSETTFRRLIELLERENVFKENENLLKELFGDENTFKQLRKMGTIYNATPEGKYHRTAEEAYAQNPHIKPLKKK